MSSGGNVGSTPVLSGRELKQEQKLFEDAWRSSMPGVPQTLRPPMKVVSPASAASGSGGSAGSAGSAGSGGGDLEGSESDDSESGKDRRKVGKAVQKLG